MTKFRATDIEPIEWDLQGSPKADAESGEITGKWRNGEEHSQGVLPEPTHDQVKAYTDGWDEFRKFVDEAGKRPDSEADTLLDDVRGRMTALLADLGFPLDMLVCLPPRQMRGLSNMVYEELISGN